jgi:hypothetical protein
MGRQKGIPCGSQGKTKHSRQNKTGIRTDNIFSLE